MTNKKRMLDLMAEYFQNEQLRDQIFTNEDVGLDAFGMDPDKKATLISLVEDDIRSTLEKELSEVLGGTPGDNTDLARAMLKRFRDLGFDAKEAKRIIHDRGQDCKPAPPAPTGLASAVAAAAYGAGEVHIRKVTCNPSPVLVNIETVIEVAGQGFAPTAEVGFGTVTTAPPEIILKKASVAREAKADVHQYLTVRATFTRPSTTWRVAVSDNGDWAWAPCTFEVV